MYPPTHTPPPHVSPNPHSTTPCIPLPTLTTPRIPQSTLTTPCIPQPTLTTPRIPQPTLTIPRIPQPTLTTPCIPQPTLTTLCIPQPTLNHPTYAPHALQLLVNCGVWLVCGSALPLLLSTLGLTRFKLLGNFLSFPWLDSITLRLGYNCVFEALTCLILTQKVSLAVIRQLPSAFSLRTLRTRAILTQKKNL